MSRNLGNIELGDIEALEEILDSLGYSTNVNTEFDNYFDMDVVWNEAFDQMNSEGSHSAEVQLKGLDYVTIYRREE